MTQLTFGEVCGEAARTSAPPHCPAAWSRAGKMLRLSRTKSAPATPSSGPPSQLALSKNGACPPPPAKHPSQGNQILLFAGFSEPGQPGPELSSLGENLETRCERRFATMLQRD